MDLLSYPSLVETPFVIVEIGGYTFGNYTKNGSGLVGRVNYPNYMRSINVTKINGQLNTYTIKMIYQIKAGDDPNFLDAIFSRNKDMYGWQKIKISYGDFSCPAFIYKEENAIITKITSNVNFQSSSIEYSLSCTSTSLPISAGSFNFPAVEAKPSDVMLNILCDKTYGMQSVLGGMKSRSSILESGLIASDDRKVRIEAMTGVSILAYFNYLVSCMACVSEQPDAIIKKYRYYMTVEDDFENKYGGAYIKIVKVESNSRVTSSQDSPDTFTVDVGYPGNNFVSSFNISNNDIWSIYYNYNKSLPETSYLYSIDNNGNLVTEYSPSITTSRDLRYTTESSKTWWTYMTEFPISATLTIKGLMKPSILMSKVRINSYFYGAKHISSGLYIIIKQNDTVDSNGYRTTLTLTRIGADDVV